MEYMKRYYALNRTCTRTNDKLNWGIKSTTKEYKTRYNVHRLDKLKPNRVKRSHSWSNVKHSKVPGVKQSTQWWRDLKEQNPEEFKRRKAIIAKRVRERRRLKQNDN